MGSNSANKGFVKSVLQLASGTAGGQLIAILVSPIITRLYTPESFGAFTVFASVFGFITVVACLRYELAIPIEKDPKKAWAITYACILVLIPFVLLTPIFLSAVKFLLEAHSDRQLPGYMLWLVPAAVLLSSLYRIVNYWAVKNEDFKAISTTKIQQALSTSIVSIGGYSFGEISLIVAKVVSQSVGVVRLLKSAVSRSKPASISRDDILEMMKKHYRFPAFSVWTGLLGVSGQFFPPIALGFLYGPAVAGQYGIASQILGLPAQLLGNAVGSVFFAKVKSRTEDGTVAVMALNVQTIMIGLSLPILVFIMIFGPELFEFVFGSAWRDAGRIARYIAPSWVMVFIAVPLQSIVLVTNGQYFEMLFFIVLLLLRVLALTIGYLYFDLMVSIAMFSAVSALCWFVYLLWMNANAGIRIRDILSVFGKSSLYTLVISGIYCIPMIVFDISIADGLIVLLSLVAVSFLARYYLLFRESQLLGEM